MNKQQLEFELKGNISDFSKNINAAKGDLKKLSEAVKESLAGLPGGSNLSKELKAAKKEAEALLKTLQALQSSGKVNLSQATPRQRTVFSGKKEAYEASLGQARPSAIDAAAEKELARLKKEQIALDKQAAAEAKASAKIQQQAAKETLAVEQAKAKAEQAIFDNAQSSLNKQITLRYALYDVAGVARQGSQALLGFASATLMAQSAQERAFANIEKTLSDKTTVDQVAKLKSEMISLGKTIPLAFEDLTQIGMLGSQLGVLAPDIASFTDTVAKFTAISGMSAEAAAMGFGKVANLLGLASSQYKSLASTISELGNTSAATEAQILSTAGQIGAVAKQAGLSASGVIGLSAAMASLRIAPEEARGVLIPTFQEMDRAVRSFNETTGTGSERLKVFASIAGVSSSDFVSQWGDKTGDGATKIWSQFISGLGKTDIGASLDKIGLAGNRTSKGLTAMAKGAGDVLDMMGTAAGNSASYIDDQFAAIVSTVDSKLKILENSFQALMASFAANPAMLNGIAAILQGIADMNFAIGEFLAKNQLASALAGIVVVTGLVAGGLLALAAVVAAGYGGFLALRTAITTAGQAGLLTGGILARLAANIAGVNIQAAAGTAAMTGLATAEGAAGTAAAVAAPKVGLLKIAIRGLLASTGIGIAIALIGMLAEGFMNTMDPAADAAKGIDETGDAADEAAQKVAVLVDELIKYSDEIFRVRGLTDAVQSSLYSLGSSFAQNGKGFSSFTKGGRENMNALHDVVQAMMKESDGDANSLYSNLTSLMLTLQAQGMLTSEAMIYLQKEIAGVATEVTGIGPLFSTAKFDLRSFIEGMKDGSKSAGKMKTALELLQEALEKAFKPFKTKLDIEESFRSLGKTMAKSKNDFRVYTDTGAANLNNLKAVIDALAISTNGNKNKMANNLAALKGALVRMGVTGGTAINVLNAALKATGKIGKASAKEIAAAIRSITTGMTEEVKKEAKTLSDWVNDLSSVMDNAFEIRYGQQASMDKITENWYGIRDAADSAKKSVEDAKIEISTLKADKSILEYQLGVAVKYGDTLRAASIRAKLGKVNSDLTQKEIDLAKAQDESSMTLVGTTQAALKNRATVRGLVGDYNNYLLSLANSGKSTAELKAEAATLADEFMAQGKALGFAESELLPYIGAFKNDFTNVITNIPRDITLKVNSDPAYRALSEFIVKFNEELANKIANEIPITVIVTPVYKPAEPITSNLPGGGNTGGGNTGGGNGGSDGSVLTPEADPNAGRKKEIAALRLQISQLEDSRVALLAEINSTKAKMSGLSSTIISATLAPKIATLNGIAADKASAIARLDNLLRAAPISAATGGLIKGPGTSTSDSIPARLSNGEYVVNAAAVRYYGTDFMNSLNKMQSQAPVNYTGGGSAQGGSSVVYLSPEDRQLLRAAIDRPVNLYTENTRIAASANAGNVVLAQRGTR